MRSHVLSRPETARFPACTISSGLAVRDSDSSIQQEELYQHPGLHRVSHQPPRMAGRRRSRSVSWVVGVAPGVRG